MKVLLVNKKHSFLRSCTDEEKYKSIEKDNTNDEKLFCNEEVFVA